MNIVSLKKISYLLPGIILSVTALLELVFYRDQIPFMGNLITQAKKNSLRQQTLLAQAVEKNHELADSLSPMKSYRQNALKLSPDKAQSRFRELLENASSASGMEIRALGENKLSVLTDELVLLELTLVSDCTLDDFLNFTSELERKQPAIYWRNLTIHGATPQSNSKISINATICILNFTPESSGDK